MITVNAAIDSDITQENAIVTSPFCGVIADKKAATPVSLYLMDLL